MASSPIPSHSQSGYSAGPSRLRISQSYPNLGREASSPVTSGSGPSSIARKKHFNFVRPGVSYIKFRSSSLAPSRPTDQHSKDKLELLSKVKSNFERIQHRYREYESDDEVDLWSMRRYTPDGRVEAWRPDGRLRGQDDGDDEDEDDEDDDEDEDEEEDEDEDGDDGGNEADDGGDNDEEEQLNNGSSAAASGSGSKYSAGNGGSDSEDELDDWAEAEAAVRKEAAERKLYLARLNDPFLSDAADDDQLTAQFFLDEEKRKARSRERFLVFRPANKVGRPRARTDPIESTTTVPATATTTRITSKSSVTATATAASAAASSSTTAHASRVQSEPPKKVRRNSKQPPKTTPTVSPVTPVDRTHVQVETPVPKRTIKIARPRAKTNPIESTSTVTSTIRRITPKATSTVVATTPKTAATATPAAEPTTRSPQKFARSFDVVIPSRSRSRTFEPEADRDMFDIQDRSSPDIRPQRLDFGVRRRPRDEPHVPLRQDEEDDDDVIIIGDSLPPSSPPPDLPDLIAPARPTRLIRPLPSTSYRQTPLASSGRLRYPLDRFDLGSNHSLSSATPPLKSSMRGSSEMSITPRAVKRTRFSLPRMTSPDVTDDAQEDHLIPLPRLFSPSDSESDDELLLVPRALSPSESESGDEEQLDEMQGVGMDREEEEEVEAVEVEEDEEEVEEDEDDPESSDDELLLVAPGSSSYRSSSTPVTGRTRSSSAVQSTPAKRPTWSPASGRLPPNLVKQYASSSPSTPHRPGLMLPPPVPLSHLKSRPKETPRSEPRPQRPLQHTAAYKRSGAAARARSRSMTEERVIKSIQLGGITFKTIAAW